MYKKRNKNIAERGREREREREKKNSKNTVIIGCHQSYLRRVTFFSAPDSKERKKRERKNQNKANISERVLS